MTKKLPISQPIPLKIVGGSQFGRYPKISMEQTWNMIVSDGFLVPYAGYALVDEYNGGEGRGIFNSERLGKMIVVVDDVVYAVDENLDKNKIGNIDTFSGDVFMDENVAQQIAICDLQDIWIYDYSTDSPTFTKAVLGATPEQKFIPGYIAFQDGYFIAPEKGKPQWRLSAINNGLSWPFSAQTVGAFQTKPDNVVAAFRMPSRGNLLMVMGSTVSEAWVDVGAALFPYQRSSQYNIDYGCLNPATIATSDEFAVWLGINEKSGPVILVSNGGPPKQISNEGWNFRFSELKYPEQSYGFLFKQDGHLLYQLTFSHPLDNLSLVYDFSTNMFFNVSDKDFGRHIAKRVAFFNNKYYFVSFIDGNLYELGSQYFTLDETEMPMVRITPHFRLPDQSYFIINNITFAMEQGVNPDNKVNLPVIPTDASYVVTSEDEYVTSVKNPDITSYVTSVDYESDDTNMNMYNFQINHAPNAPRVDLSLSKDGGETFGSSVSKWMNPVGFRRNRMNFWSLGSANEITVQLRFQGRQRFVVTDGEMSIYR